MADTHEESQCTQKETSNSKSQVRNAGLVVFEGDMSNHDGFCGDQDWGNASVFIEVTELWGG